MSEFKITSENFDDEVLASALPVLLDFYASWCGPCKMLSPIIEEIANKYEGRVRVGKIDVDEQNALAEKFGVMSIPTLITFKSGEVVDISVGFKPKKVITDMIDKLL